MTNNTDEIKINQIQVFEGRTVRKKTIHDSSVVSLETYEKLSD